MLQMLSLHTLNLKNNRTSYQIVYEKSFIFHYLTEGSEENFYALFITVSEPNFAL